MGEGEVGEGRDGYREGKTSGGGGWKGQRGGEKKHESPRLKTHKALITDEDDHHLHPAPHLMTSYLCIYLYVAVLL